MLQLAGKIACTLCLIGVALAITGFFNMSFFRSVGENKFWMKVGSSGVGTFVAGLLVSIWFEN